MPAQVLRMARLAKRMPDGCGPCRTVTKVTGVPPAASDLWGMSYHFSKTLQLDFDSAIAKVTDELKKEGFGILTEIDMQAALRNKLGVDFRPYKILGACNPPFAHKAVLAEPRIGTMLPCNVVVQEHASGRVEVSAVDPAASMMAISNAELAGLAQEVGEKLKRVIAAV